MKNTSEPLKMSNGTTPPGEEVQKLNSGVFLVKGPEFHEKFMAAFAMPRRSETAMMVLASHIQRYGIDRTNEAMAKMAWDMADAFVLAERATLDKRMAEYWDLYMASNKQTDEVIDALIDSHQDYSA
jgi:hypothetical protein